MPKFEAIGTQIKKNPQNNNEITLIIKIEKNDTNNIIYFLDDTKENEFYFENNKPIIHNNDNLSELNVSNTTLIINEEIVPFKKYFKPTKKGTYSIKLILNIKSSNCAYMFYN